MMNRLHHIEEQTAELPHVLGVTLIVFHAACEAARADEQLTSGCIVAMRLLAREGLTRDFLEQSFTDADARNPETAQIETTPDRDNPDRRAPHHVAPLPPHPL